MIPNIFILSSNGYVKSYFIILYYYFSELILEKHFVDGYKKSISELFWDELNKYENKNDVFLFNY